MTDISFLKTKRNQTENKIQLKPSATLWHY